jgi:hypothetical protein
MPVITSGDAWVRGKGITLDPVDKAEYFSTLSKAISQPLPFDLQRAQKFAYFYFFRKMIEIPSLRKGTMFVPIEIRATEQDAGLRRICEAIEACEDVLN